MSEEAIVLHGPSSTHKGLWLVTLHPQSPHNCTRTLTHFQSGIGNYSFPTRPVTGRGDEDLEASHPATTPKSEEQVEKSRNVVKI